MFFCRQLLTGLGENMYKITRVINNNIVCSRDDGGEEIILDEQTLRKARRCIDEMIRLGG